MFSLLTLTIGLAGLPEWLSAAPGTWCEPGFESGQSGSPSHRTSGWPEEVCLQVLKSQRRNRFNAMLSFRWLRVEWKVVVELISSKYYACIGNSLTGWACLRRIKWVLTEYVKPKVVVLLLHSPWSWWVQFLPSGRSLSILVASL